MAEDAPARVADVVQRDVGGETFLVPIRGCLVDLQELYALNESGRWLWEHLDGRHNVEDLATGLVAEFDVDERCALSDTWVFLDELREAGLIHADPEPRDG
ncbi:MAG: PqqD family protein [Thermoleophilia bacterium]|nr:PqqD family protein [Thermoleophilia bacterium]